MPANLSAKPDRFYSVIEVKAFDDEKRELEGIASTPTTDRMGDIVEPDGAEFKLPLPLLWQHNSREPIGHVISAKVSKNGITIKAKLAKIEEEGDLKRRLDMAWQSIKSGLVRGLSIGFRSLEDSNIKETFGIRFIKWEWLELSAVTIPANVEATITAIKSADELQRAASGATRGAVVTLAKSAPGVTGSTAVPQTGAASMKTIKEQIEAFEAKRAANTARMEALMAAAGEKGETLDEAATQEFDGLQAENETIDSHLKRLKVMQKANEAKAAAAPANPDPATGRVPAQSAVRVTNNLPKGMAFVRFVKALAMSRGNLMQAEMIARGNQSWMDQTPQVAEILKTAVAAGTTTGAAWADDLVYNQNLVAEFIEYLRPQTILGRLTGLRRVPFNIRVGSQTSGSTAYWVGEGKPIPVSKLQTDNVSLGLAKAGGLVVLSEELVRSSAPSAEMLVRDDLTKTLATFLDVQFVDPNFGPVTASGAPGAVTYGVTPVTPTGTTAAALRADIRTLFDTWITNNVDPADGVWIMSPSIALSISLMMNSLGQPEFPGLTMNGGTFQGLPVITSMSAYVAGSPNYAHMIILAKQSDIFLADDGGVVIDASREAALQMDDAPTNDTSTPTATQVVSMFQTESVAIKATRFINWKKRRSTAVAFIRTAAYADS